MSHPAFALARLAALALAAAASLAQAHPAAGRHSQGPVLAVPGGPAGAPVQSRCRWVCVPGYDCDYTCFPE